MQLVKFIEIVEVSFRERAPHKICEYIYDLSNNFNKFYSDTKILTEENNYKKNSWLNLINLVKVVLEECLDLLGIKSVDKM